ncbi:MAG: DMT family transporter [Acidobacteriota bacterium]|nr:DMT family transporter [Acidobacteriota bacterium]
MHERRVGLLYIVVAALLWSTGGIGIKAVVDPPLKVSFYRSLFAALTLFVIFRRDLRVRLSPAFIAAILSYAGCLTTFVTATKWTTAANAIFLQYAGVVWVLLLSPIVLHEAMRRRDVIAIVVAMAGMALFFVGKFEARGMAGNGMALLSSVFFAMMILALRREHASSRAAVTWGNVLLAIALLPFVANDLAITRTSLLAFSFLGIIQIGLAYAFFVKGLRYVTATEASLTGMLEPVANPIWVLLFLGEKPSAFAIAGGVIVLAAIAWHTSQGEPVSELPAVD